MHLCTTTNMSRVNRTPILERVGPQKSNMVYSKNVLLLSARKGDHRIRRVACCCEAPRSQSEPQPKVQSFNESSDYDTWPAVQQPPPRRLIIGALTAAGIALGGNLGGVTSALLGLDGGNVAGSLKLDSIIPVTGVKRCLGDGFEFLYPSDWLADATIYRRRAESAEARLGLALPDIERAERVARRQATVEPLVAFGPMGSTGEDNISVVVAPSPAHPQTPYFSVGGECVDPLPDSQGTCNIRLQNLGTPAEVGEQLLAQRFAPAGSDKVASLVDASQRKDARGLLYYQIEYKIERHGPRAFKRHNLSVLCAYNDNLYTLNAQSSEVRWAQYSDKFQRAAASFNITLSE